VGGGCARRGIELEKVRLLGVAGTKLRRANGTGDVRGTAFWQKKQDHCGEEAAILEGCAVRAT
jgi:hypothetical protein